MLLLHAENMMFREKIWSYCNFFFYFSNYFLALGMNTGVSTAWGVLENALNEELMLQYK